MIEPVQHDFPLPSEKKTRLVGIVLIAICTALAGLFFLLAGAGLFLQGEFTSIPTILCLLFSILMMSTAYGLWTLKIWSYNLTRVICAVAILLCLLVVSAKGISPISGLIMIVAIGVLIYLHRKESRTLFAIGYFESSNSDDKSTNQEQAILSHNQSSLPSVTLASHSKSVEQEVSMEGGSVMNEIWQRLVVRGIKNPSSIVCYIVILYCLLLVSISNVNLYVPVPSLSELKKYNGEITRVYELGRTKNMWVTINLGNEKSEKLRLMSGFYSEFNFLQSLEGKEVTFWVQPIVRMSSFWFEEVQWIRQVKYEGKLIIGYKKHVKKILISRQNNGWMNHLKDIVVIAVIGFFLALVWRDNK